MKISIITVTYNCVKTIEDTLLSIISQKEVEKELVVVDGFSSDGTCDVINKYIDNIAYFISEPDKGIYDAMNKALLHISGEVILFMNSGDTFYDDKALYRALGFFDVETDVLICKELIDGKICDTFSPSINHSIYIDAFFPHQATISKGYLYKEDGYFDESYSICADYDWILREYFLGRKLKWCDEVVAIYDSNGVSSSLKSIAEQYLISRKYVLLSNNKNEQDYLDTYYSIEFRKTFFRNLIKKSVSNKDIKSALTEQLDGKDIAIWGAGLIGKMLYNFLSKNEIEIKSVYDSRPSSNEFVKVINPDEYISNSSEYIIISSEYFEKEIGLVLREYGKIEGVDYVSYSTFSNELTCRLLEKGYDDQDFNILTGLNVLKNLRVYE